MSRKTKRARTPAQIAAELERARERRAQEAAEQRSAAKDPKKWGIDMQELERQGVEVTASVRGGQAAAHRKDIFSRMLDGRLLSVAAFDAIRRLEADTTERRPPSGGSTGERVSSSGAKDVLSQRMLEAGRRVDAALGLIGRRDAAFLRELLEPHQVELGPPAERWRQVVRVMLGETQANAQAAALRSAVENLAWAYRELDNMPRRAA